ncbi:MAG TPA: YqhR family membrane protein [Bacillales bacterium]|nr:YqhR family membrane protein [Bacillales bacterium]
MQGEDRKIHQDNKKKPTSYTSKCVVIGFWGGLISSFIGYLAYLLNFTTFGPALVLTPWQLGDWKDDPIGQVVAIFAIAVVSIVTALVYKVLLERLYSMWVSVGYGIVIWLFVFYVLNPIFPKLEPITEFDQNTLVTTLCLYILYGLFIGYSISFEYHELNRPQKSDSSDTKGQHGEKSES